MPPRFAYKLPKNDLEAIFPILERWPLKCCYVVGDTGFEPVTSSVSKESASTNHAQCRSSTSASRCDRLASRNRSTVPGPGRVPRCTRRTASDLAVPVSHAQASSSPVAVASGSGSARWPNSFEHDGRQNGFATGRRPRTSCRSGSPRYGWSHRQMTDITIKSRLPDLQETGPHLQFCGRDGGIRTHDPLTPSSPVAQRHARACLPRSSLA